MIKWTKIETEVMNVLKENKITVASGLFGALPQYTRDEIESTIGTFLLTGHVSYLGWGIVDETRFFLVDKEKRRCPWCGNILEAFPFAEECTLYECFEEGCGFRGRGWSNEDFMPLEKQHLEWYEDVVYLRDGNEEE